MATPKGEEEGGQGPGSHHGERAYDWGKKRGREAWRGGGGAVRG